MRWEALEGKLILKKTVIKIWMRRNWRKLAIIFLIIIASYHGSFLIIELSSNQPVVFHGNILFWDNIDKKEWVNMHIQTVYFYFNKEWTQIRYYLYIYPSEGERIKNKNITFYIFKDTNKIFNVENLKVYWATEMDAFYSRYRKPDKELRQIENGEESGFVRASYSLENVVLDDNTFLWIILEYKDSIYPVRGRYFPLPAGDLIVSIEIIGKFINGSNAIIAIPQGIKVGFRSPSSSYEVTDAYVKNMSRLSYNIKDTLFKEVIILNYLNIEFFVAFFALLVSIIFGVISFFQRK